MLCNEFGMRPLRSAILCRKPTSALSPVTWSYSAATSHHSSPISGQFLCAERLTYPFEPTAGCPPHILQRIDGGDFNRCALVYVSKKSIYIVFQLCMTLSASLLFTFTHSRDFRRIFPPRSQAKKHCYHGIYDDVVVDWLFRFRRFLPNWTCKTEFTPFKETFLSRGTCKHDS